MGQNMFFRSMAFGALLLSSVAAMAQGTTIQFRFNDSEKQEMRAALDAFEAANPGIKVELQTLAWKDARDQFLREAAVGGGPDVVHIAQVWTKELAEAGTLMPLDQLTGYGALGNGIEDFFATDLTMYENKSYGVPWTADTWAMVYRADVLKAAGTTIPKSWDDLLAMSRAVKEKTGKAGFAFAGGNQVWFPVNYYLWSNGAAFIVEDGAGGYKLGVTKQQLVAAMNYFKTFVEEGLAPRSIVSVNVPHDPALLQALLDGNQAASIMPTNTYRELLAAYAQTHPGEPVPFTSGITMSGSQPPLTHLGGRTLVVNAGTKHPEAAWKLVQFLTSAHLFEKYYTNQFPAQKSLLGEIDFKPEEMGFAKQLAEYAGTWGAYSEGPVNIGQLWNTTARSFSAAISGQMSSEQAADELLAELDRMIGG